IRTANLMMGELLGVEPGKLVGKIFVSYLPVPRRRVFRALCNQMMDTGAAGKAGVVEKVGATGKAGVAGKVGATGQYVRVLETTLARPNKMLVGVTLRVIAVRTLAGELELRWAVRDMSGERIAHKALLDEVRHRQQVEESLRSS